MKTTTKKRFDQLEPGDVLPVDAATSLVVYTVIDNGPGACRDVLCMVTGMRGTIRSLTQASADTVEVVSNLTPAQPHADELVDMLRELADRGSAGHVDHNSLCGRARRLFDKIDPPQPPTLDEALRLLASWPSAHRTPLPPGDEPLTLTTEKLLDRARRSGVLK